jgi:hypothetical protein
MNARRSNPRGNWRPIFGRHNVQLATVELRNDGLSHTIFHRTDVGASFSEDAAAALAKKINRDGGADGQQR